METIKFKGDSATRRRFMVPESCQHPAKMHIGLFLEILHRYCPEPCTILDPMAGSGTVLLAAQYGHRVIANELEQHFVLPMIESWKKIQVNGPALGYEMGHVEIVQGDARDPSFLGEVDSILTSPPYEGSIQGEPGIDWTKVDGGKRDRTKEPSLPSIKARLLGYTRLDAIVTSPPFQERKAYEGQELQENQRIQQGGFATLPHAVSANMDNIGNLRAGAYWESMKAVYRECYRVLKPGGILCLVLKGFTRNGQYIDLPTQTSELVQTLGFVPHDHWCRRLWSLSFWRILQQRRDPEAFDDRLRYEEVLAFRKGGGQRAGGGGDYLSSLRGDQYIGLGAHQQPGYGQFLY